MLTRSAHCTRRCTHSCWSPSHKACMMQMRSSLQEQFVLPRIQCTLDLVLYTHSRYIWRNIGYNKGSMH
jgi:hypothetical protein